MQTESKAAVEVVTGKPYSLSKEAAWLHLQAVCNGALEKMMNGQPLDDDEQLIYDEAEGLPILTERKEGPVSRVMSNSFGFGGTNACLVFDKYEG